MRACGTAKAAPIAHREDGDRDGPQPATGTAAGRAAPSTAGATSGSGGYVDLLPERAEPRSSSAHRPLLLASSARSRSSARARRDLTVPRRTPSVAAVSSSESSSK